MNEPDFITTSDRGQSPVKSAVGLYQFSPAAIAHPTTEKDLVESVRYAHRNGLRISAIGALHSAVPLPATQGLCVVLDRYKKALKVDGPLVTVESGMRLWELNDFLAKQGLALPTLGTIALQTVSGAVSTGTHGGSIYRTSLSGYIEEIRLVRADGKVVRVNRTDEVMKGVAIALGSLGVISTITFRCIPACSLQTQVCTMPMASLLERFDSIHHQNRYVDLRYSPITDQVHAALINSTTQPLNNGGWQPSKISPFQQKLTDWINKSAMRFFNTHRFNWLQRWGIKRYDRDIYSAVYGRSDFVLTHFDATSTDLLANEERSQLDPVADMEVAIPYEQAITALRALRNYFQRTRRFPSMHVHIRTQAAEPFWLSPTRGQDICWLEFWEYPRTGKFFEEMMTVLRPFDPVGHWGKQLPQPPDTQYSHWRDFTDLRNLWDPQKMFSNSYLDKIFQPTQPTPSARTITLAHSTYAQTYDSN
ncbi:MAG: D-arabinono-1,4-lactone oxidase [Cyanobacteria bacterium J06634_6]